MLPRPGQKITSCMPLSAPDHVSPRQAQRQVRCSTGTFDLLHISSPHLWGSVCGQIRGWQEAAAAVALEAAAHGPPAPVQRVRSGSLLLRPLLPQVWGPLCCKQGCHRLEGRQCGVAAPPLCLHKSRLQRTVTDTTHADPSCCRWLHALPALGGGTAIVSAGEHAYLVHATAIFHGLLGTGW